MVEEQDFVESLPNRPLKQEERQAFANHEKFEFVIPHDVNEDPETGAKMIHAALFATENHVLAVKYVQALGWQVVYTAEKDDEDLGEGGFLTTEDLDEGHPVREGMLALVDDES